MKKIPFLDHWLVTCLSDPKIPAIETDVPYDALLREPRLETAEGGVNTAWFQGCDYRYAKKFQKPALKEGELCLIEFEGVYRNAEIRVNGKDAFRNAYGYNTFHFDLTPFLKEGENEIEVVCHNADQPNSRWYSGTGIYRPVHLFLLPKEHFEYGSTRIRLLDLEGNLQVEGKTNADGPVSIAFFDQEGKETLLLKGEAKGGRFQIQGKMPDLHAWDEEDPYLYQVKAAFFEDEVSIKTGLRILSWGKDGFFVNGKKTLLKGACIHHDNGLLGAEEYRDCECRKVRLLKEAGYNAIRSAHHPMCKDMLDACDELGMYVMEEYVDCWYIHKTKYDYVNELQANWENDLDLMVEKDFNHPSVLFYSLGNEVAETSEKKGVELLRKFVEHIKASDPTRMTTCGVNIFFNALYSWGFGVYSDKKAEGNKQAKAKKGEVGSAFFNKIANFMGSNIMKVGSTIHRCDVKTRDAFALLDAPGYNYALYRYKHDLKKYPNRLIVGSETFCIDAWRWQKYAEKNPRVIGDFVWAGIDYLGECGVGSWVNEEDATSFNHGCGWITAGSGRIDITGRFLGEAFYTQAMYDKKTIALSIVPPREQRLKHSPSAWKLSMAWPTYTFKEQEIGKPVLIEIYTKAPRFALYLDEKLIKKGKTNSLGRTIVKTKYHPGTLKVIALDEKGKPLGEDLLASGNVKEAIATLHPESKDPTPNDHLLYVRIALGDKDGNINPDLKSSLTIDNVKGGKLLGFGNGSPFHPESYLSNQATAYMGEALAIFKVDDIKEFDFRLKSDWNEVRFKE